MADRLFLQLGEERIGGAEGFIDHLFQPPGGLLSGGREAGPEEIVVPHLPGVVEQAFVPLVQGEADHLNQRAAAQILFLDPAVHLVDIGLVVLAMVEIQRLSRHVRGQRVPAERKRQKFKSHETTPYINNIWGPPVRSEEHTSALQSLMRTSY